MTEAKELNTKGGSNRFKYQSFADRIKALNVDVIHRVGSNSLSRLDLELADGSYFVAGLRYWREMNCTEHFTNFSRDVASYAQSFNQVVFHKEEIMGILLNHLNIVDSLALEPLIDLMSLLANDLRSEILSHFPALVLSLADILRRSADARIIECAFHGLGYLYKYLRKDLVQDVPKAFMQVAPLLKDRHQYIRSFMGPGFAFLLRKLTGVPLVEVIQFVVRSCQDIEDCRGEDYQEGLAVLLFETMKGSQSTFHSKALPVFRALLNGARGDDDVGMVVKKTTRLAVIHANAESIQPFIEEVCSFTASSTAEHNLMFGLSVLKEMCLLRKGNRIAHRLPWMQRLHALDRRVETAAPGTQIEYISTLVALATSLDMQECIQVRKMVEDVLKWPNTDMGMLVMSLLVETKWSQFNNMLLGMCMSLLQRLWAVQKASVLLFLSRFVRSGYSQRTSASLSLFAADGRLRLPQHLHDGLIEMLEMRVDDLVQNDSRLLSQTGCAIQIISRINIQQPQRVMKQLYDLVRRCLNASCDPSLVQTDVAEGPGATALLLKAIASEAIRTFCALSDSANITEGLDGLVDLVWEKCLPTFRNDQLCLAAAFAIMERFKAIRPEFFSIQRMKQLHDILLPNLLSTMHACRLNSLRLLALFDQLPVQDPSGSNPSACNIFELCIDAEEIENSVSSVRDKIVRFRRIEMMVVNSQVLPYFYAPAVVSFLLGMLTVNFQPIWAEASRIAMSICNVNFRDESGKAKPGREVVWNVLFDELQKFQTFDEPERRFAVARWSDEVLHGVQADASGASAMEDMFSDISIRRQDALIDACLRQIDQGPDLLLSELVVCTHDVEELKRYRFRPWNYFDQLMSAISNHNPKLAEQHAEKDLAPMFLRFYSSEYLNDEDQEGAQSTNRKRLVAFLTLLSKFSKAETSLKCTELNASLKAIYERMLMKSDPQLQQLGLTCLLSYASSLLLSYREILQQLVDEKTFRDALAILGADDESTVVIAEQDRMILMRTVIRILYGKVIRRKSGGGASSASIGGMIARRSAVLTFLARCRHEELNFFVQLILEPFANILKSHEDEPISMKFAFVPEAVVEASVRQQLGYLHHLEDLCKQMGGFLAPFLRPLLITLLYVMRKAQRSLKSSMDVDSDEASELKQLREVRTLGLRRLSDLFALKINQLHESDGDVEMISHAFDFRPYLPAMFQDILDPRLEVFEHENTQAPTALMDLFWRWSTSICYVRFLSDYNPQVLPKIFACLSATNVKSTVISRVLEIVENLLQLRDGSGESCSLGYDVLIPFTTLFIAQLQHLMGRADSLHVKGMDPLNRDQLTRRQIFILSQLAVYSTDSHQLWNLVDLLIPFLKAPVKKVNMKVKGDILKILVGALPSWLETKGKDAIVTESSYFSIVCQLFASCDTRDSREIICAAFEIMTALDPRLKRINSIIQDMNAYSTNRLDDRDWKRRLAAFQLIPSVTDFLPFEWVPLLHNLIFYAHDSTEISIRSQSTHCLSQFVQRSRDSETLFGYVMHIVWPAIKRALKSHSESVRREFVIVLGDIVKAYSEISQFSDMKCLLADNDDEANFFLNVYHIQLHRRARAIRRLIEFAKQGKLRSGNLVHVLIPLVAHFVFESDRKVDHQLINDSISAVGVLSGQLPWNQYYATLRQYQRLLPKKPALEKTLLRVILSILDNMTWKLNEVNYEEYQRYIKPSTEKSTEKDDESSDSDSEEGEEVLVVDSKEKELQFRILFTIKSKILPHLFDLLTNHKEGEANLNIRVPVAMTYTRLLTVLPHEILQQELPKLLTTVSQILRSRSQEVRDITRTTMAEIALTLGSRYFLFVVKELSGALRLGYQMHVLGYTMHTLLTKLVPTLQPGDIDHCIPAIVEVLLNDIFGEVGEEKEVKELAQKMKETKARKSFESFELLSKSIQFGMLERVLIPMRDLMVHMHSSSFTARLQEVLNRLVLGLNANNAIEDVDLLIFIFQLITKDSPMYLPDEVLAEERARTQTLKPTSDNFERNFAIQSFERTDKQREIKNHFRNNEHLFEELGFRLLLTSLKRGRYNPKDPQHRNMLDPFLVVLKDCLLSKNVRVVIDALKILSILIRSDLPSADEIIPACLERSFKLIHRSSSTNTDLVQNCFKLVAVIVREKPDVPITEKQLAALISVIRPDLELPEKQATTFSLIRSILARKAMIPEVYQLMDDVRSLMVSSQIDQIRESCRIALLQFLLDYPLGPKRLEKVMQFLAQNLEYVYESGRISVLEFINSITIKFPVEVLNDYAEFLFISMVVCMLKDDSERCRELTAAVSQSLLQHVSVEKFAAIMDIVLKWCSSESVQLKQTFVRALGVVIDSVADMNESKKTWFMDRYMQIIHDRLLDCLSMCASLSAKDAEDPDETWTVAYFGLNCVYKLLKACPSTEWFAEWTAIWKTALHQMLCYHGWVRKSAARLFGLYLSLVDPATLCYANTKTPSFVCETDILFSSIDTSVKQLAHVSLNEDLAEQVIKNLVFVGKALYAQVVATSEQTNEAIKEEEDAAHSKPTPTIKLRWMFRKLSLLARSEQNGNKSTLVRSNVFKWFAAMTMVLADEDIATHLDAMLGALYRVEIDETAKGTVFDELKELGAEVQSMLEKKVGNTVFHRIRHRIERSIAEKREERRKLRHVQAVVDPEARAKRKLAKNEMKKNARKRKTEEYMKHKTRLSVKKARIAR